MDLPERKAAYMTTLNEVKHFSFIVLPKIDHALLPMTRWGGERSENAPLTSSAGHALQYVDVRLRMHDMLGKTMMCEARR